MLTTKSAKDAAMHETPVSRRITNRWTGARIASFSTCSVRRRLDVIAAPGQLNRSMLLFLMNRTHAMRMVITAMLYFAALDVSARQRPVPKDFSYPEGSQTIQIEINA